MITSDVILTELQFKNLHYLYPLVGALGGGLIANHVDNVSSMKNYIDQVQGDIVNNKVPQQYDPSVFLNVLKTAGGTLGGLSLGSAALGLKLSKEKRENDNRMSNILNNVRSN